MFDTITLQILPKQSVLLGAFILMVITSGCASFDRCKETGGIVFDVTALTTSPNGDLMAGGTLYRLGNCVAEELLNKGGKRPRKGLLLSVSGDRGKSWDVKRIPVEQLQDLPNQYELRGLAASKDGTVFAGVNLWWDRYFGGRDDNARLLKSGDKGHTWEQVYDFGHDYLLSTVTLPDSVVLVALCRQGVMRSPDNGQTWIQTGLKSMDGKCPIIEPTSNNTGEMYAYAWGRNGPGFYRSNDAGITWIRMPLPAARNRARIAANDKGDVVATISGPWEQEVYRSSDHGKTWTKVTSPNKCWTEQLGISPDGTILLRSMDNIFCGANGGSFISTDAGNSWTQLSNWGRTEANDIPGEDPLVTDPSGFLYAYKRVDFSGPFLKWWWGGTIYYSDDTGRTWRTINPLLEKVPE